MSITAPTSPVLTVLTLTSGTLSNADGYKLLLALKAALAEQPGPVMLDLAALYEELGASSYKRLRLNNYKPAQLKQLKEYMADVAQTHEAK
jgi:hypothetical protein